MVQFRARAQNLRQDMKTSFKTRVSRMGLGSSVNINIFVMTYYFFQFVYILHFLESLKSKSSQMLRPLKGNSVVSFNDTLLKLYSTIQQCMSYILLLGEYTQGTNKLLFTAWRIHTRDKRASFYCLKHLLLEKNAIFYCLGHLSWDQVFHYST